MPTLTTTGGTQVTFVAAAVSALVDHDASTGKSVTCIYGVTNTVLRISESVQAFMTRLKFTRKFAQLNSAERISGMDERGRCFLDPCSASK